MPRTLLDVGVEHCCIQTIALEAAPQEERAAAPQDAADDGQVQVDARGDVRQVQTFFIGHVTKQQVVEVTTVARHVNHFLVVGNLVEFLSMIKFDAVIHLLP